jgi:hypothetical protein
VSTEWFDYIEDDTSLDTEHDEAFYCPYTNAAQCALLTKGWQPQELCMALECEQVKLVERNRGANRRHKAA